MAFGVLYCHGGLVLPVRDPPPPPPFPFFIAEYNALLSFSKILSSFVIFFCYVLSSFIYQYRYYTVQAAVRLT
jgi:hypothetical protein